MIRIYERSSITRHTLGTIATDSTGGGELNLVEGTDRQQPFHSGVIRGIAISCDSTDFDVSLRTHSNAQADTPSEVYRVTNNSKYRKDDDLFIGWINRDSPAKGSLYLVLVNKDLQTATGAVTIEVHSDIPKRFSRNR